MNIRALLPGLQKLLKEVGEYLVRVQGDVRREMKGPRDLVSEADRTAERMLREGLATLFPEALFRGEESGWSPWPEDAWCWVVDPLDGTRPYLDGEDAWAISVALFEGKVAMLGAIRIPTSDKTYLAVRGKGATLDGEALRVSGTPFERARLAVHSGKGGTLQEAGLLDRHPGVSLVKAYATTTLCAMVLRGEAEAYVKLHLDWAKEWDVAAASVLIEEAGGKCTDLDGKPPAFGKTDPSLGWLILSNGACHEELLAALRELDLPSKAS